MRITIENARIEQSTTIARMTMEAMNHECCQWFAGKEHSLDDFFELMKELVESEKTQYSYRNTLVAKNDRNEIVGMCISYDGGMLRDLRKAFVDGVRQSFGRDFSEIPDETQAGELYIDSLCVDKDCRGLGIASQLLKAAIEKGRNLNLPTGLLVDKNNPKAEKLYQRVGFEYVNDNEWGGHAMKHLVFPL
ncbi:GNAT family N-acetyltransferase [Prevotella corporis]|uniref:GNAT family N-acetyltransferase n=1 Tax=Prevotella corporis TaxID=28128 RepID=UPI0023F4DC88|nr:GNAT family N-acetyltransferase [Prevotella corporis]MDQ7737503.1 GNAT family N-acetyltransferase [Prevotella corporis]